MGEWDDWEVEWALMSARERRMAVCRGEVPGHVLVYAMCIGRLPSDEDLERLGQPGAREKVMRGLRYARLLHLAKMMTAALKKEEGAHALLDRAKQQIEHWKGTTSRVAELIEEDL